jgi:YrbI family 3-deoxy-D-manno-octulosonate 8-phosphate phosphatase
VGLPRKNILKFAGRPLVAWSIQRALQCDAIDAGVWVSTDSEEVSSVAREYGAGVVDRPARFAGGQSPSEDAVVHALGAIESERGRVETVIMLQPTSPLRQPHDLGRALVQFRDQGLDSLFSGTPTDDITLWAHRERALESVTYNWRNRGMRQTRAPHVLENGSFYVSRRDLLVSTRNRLGGQMGYYPMPAWQSIEIDNAEDFRLCEALGRHYGLTWGRRSLPRNLDGIVMDFDGVFTSNMVYVNDVGSEMVRCSRGDGLAVSAFRAAHPGVPIVILSSETNAVVRTRAAKLGLEAITGVQDKWAGLVALCAERGWLASRVAYVGNDINDLECMRRVGFGIAPADAVSEVLCEADLILSHCGGNGAVREVCERLADTGTQTNAGSPPRP